MKRLTVVLAALALSGCDITFPTAPSESSSVAVNVTTTVHPPAPDPTPPPADDEDALCPAARGLDVSGFGGPAPATVSVGDTVRLDATPTDAQGQPRTPQCDELRGIEWTVDGPCSIDDPESFTPTLAAEDVGTCTATAFVESVDDSVSFEVQ